MKISHLSETSAGATSSGAVAPVSQALSTTQKRTNPSIYKGGKVGSLFKGKQTDKPFANSSISEGIEQSMAEGTSYNIDQDDHDEFTPAEIERIKNSHFPDTLRDNLRLAKKQALQRKHFSSSSDGGETNLGSPVGSSSDNTYEGVAEGWKEKVAGAALGAAVLAGIANSPMAYVKGQQIHMAMPGTIPDNAKSIIDDNGKKIYVWRSHPIKNSPGNTNGQLVYRPAEQVKEQGVAEGSVDPKHKQILNKEKTKVPRVPKNEYEREVEKYLKKKYSKDQGVAEGVVDTIKKVGKALVKPVKDPILNQMKDIHNTVHKREIAAQNKKYAPKDVAEGEGPTQKYEMMLRNGQVKKFVAKDDADAKRIAAGQGAKSLIKLKGGIPAGKVAEGELDEKAVSKQQQKFFGMAHAMQKGEKIKGASPELKKVAKSMSKQDVKDFASTKHKGLPKKVSEVAPTSDLDVTVDPELKKAIGYAKAHYPASKNSSDAFHKFVQRSIKHAKEDDTAQNIELKRLANEIQALKSKIAVSKVPQAVEESEINEEDLILIPGKGRRLKPGLLHKTESSINPVDTIKVDIPLLIRLLEYAREDASGDLDLHDLAEKLVAISDRGRTLTMRDYERLVDVPEEQVDEVSDELSKSYLKGAMRDTISGKKDRNTGMRQAIARLSGTNKPLIKPAEDVEEATDLEQREKTIYTLRGLTYVLQRGADGKYALSHDGKVVKVFATSPKWIHSWLDDEGFVPQKTNSNIPDWHAVTESKTTKSAIMSGLIGKQDK